MANATDFLGAIYNELHQLLNLDDASQGVVMQMAWPGLALSPADFKPASAPNGAYDPEVAKETFSELANIAPIFNRARYENSGYQIDDLYEILISSAIPGGASTSTSSDNPLHKLFSDAQFELLQARRGSHDDPNVFYFPCAATPSNWYDEATAQFWPSLNIQSKDVKQGSPSSPFGKTGGLSLAQQGVWRLKAAAGSEATIKANLAKEVISRGQSAQPAAASVISRPLATHAAVALRADAAPRSAAARAPALAPDSRATLRPAFVANLRSARTQTMFTTKSVPSSAFDASLSRQVTTLDPTALRPNLKRGRIAQQVLLRDLLIRQLPQKPSSASDGFSISFRYCRVNIDRPWLKLALLSSKSWYMYGTQSGEYSSGDSVNNSGMFPLLPTSFIVVRDLKISANWSADDKQTIANAASFGFFDLSGASLQANVLEIRGLQLLGWISKVMPMLPPLSPP